MSLVNGFLRAEYRPTGVPHGRKPSHQRVSCIAQCERSDVVGGRIKHFAHAGVPREMNMRVDEPWGQGPAATIDDRHVVRCGNGRSDLRNLVTFDQHVHIGKAVILTIEHADISKQYA